MRVLEPHYFETLKQQRKKKRVKKRYVISALLICVGVVSYVMFGQELITKQVSNTNQPTDVQQQAVVAAKPKVLKTFTAAQFKSLYNAFVYPNTQPITDPPVITGYPEVDVRIRAIAVRRGYKLSALPVASIVKTGEPGLDGDDLIQPNALMAWQQLKASAASEHIPLQMTSAYRSIEYQRALFLRRMKDAGVNVYTIMDGHADDELETVLSRAAIPGYSRHHTGYTMDLACDGVGLDAFIRTKCYTWLSKNNFENAKKAGWVPSYPEGATQTGPEPEPWEFIWVGTNSLYE